MEREKWEYKTRFCFDAANAEQMDLLNTLGDEGWELVSAFHQDASTYRFYFKRRK